MAVVIALGGELVGRALGSDATETTSYGRRLGHGVTAGCGETDTDEYHSSSSANEICIVGPREKLKPHNHDRSVPA